MSTLEVLAILIGPAGRRLLGVGLMPNTCSGCTTTWSGLNICHCSACHRTFTILRWFDAHRANGGACADPVGLKHETGSRIGQPLMRLSERGFWTDFRSRPSDLPRSGQVVDDASPSRASEEVLNDRAS